jgi:hypothetical protein
MFIPPMRTHRLALEETIGYIAHHSPPVPGDYTAPLIALIVARGDA